MLSMSFSFCLHYRDFYRCVTGKANGGKSFQKGEKISNGVGGGGAVSDICKCMQQKSFPY